MTAFVNSSSLQHPAVGQSGGLGGGSKSNLAGPWTPNCWIPTSHQSNSTLSVLVVYISTEDFLWRKCFTALKSSKTTGLG